MPYWNDFPAPCATTMACVADVADVNSPVVVKRVASHQERIARFEPLANVFEDTDANSAMKLSSVPFSTGRRRRVHPASVAGWRVRCRSFRRNGNIGFRTLRINPLCR